MSAKNCDRKKRWRCKTVAFRVSPAEADRLDMQVMTSGMTKQDFIIMRLMNEDIIIRPNIRIQKYLQQYLIDIANELRRIERIEQDSDILEMLAYLLGLIKSMGNTAQ